MIFLTGDTHGFHDADKIFKLSSRIPRITDDKENYLIIAGDFGCIWRYPERASLKLNSNDLHTIEYIYEDAPLSLSLWTETMKIMLCSISSQFLKNGADVYIS